jgi:hypothetical protein
MTDDARGPMGPPDCPALADHHATPDRAPVSLARQNSEARRTRFRSWHG